jgi:RNA polymerase sigma factor (sigma-70 family)
VYPDDASRTDPELWVRAKGGDQQAFGCVYERHVDSVFRICLRRLGSWADADEVTSMVFFEAWRHREDARFAGESLRPWLYAIAANLARNQSRSRRRFSSLLAKLPSVGSAPDIAVTVVDEAVQVQLSERIAFCISRLSGRDQDVIVLCDVGETAYADAAAALGIPIGTLKSRLARARTKLRVLLAEVGVHSASDAADDLWCPPTQTVVRATRGGR